MTERINPAFQTLLDVKELEFLENLPHTVFGIWYDYSLAYMNEYWFTFANENGADQSFFDDWKLGCEILKAIPEPLESFYQSLFQKVLSSPVPLSVKHRYHCPTPLEYREYEMSISRLARGAGAIMIHREVECKKIERALYPECLNDDAYKDEEGRVHQCCSCRRAENLNYVECWDWMSKWVERVPRDVLNLLCPMCCERYLLEVDALGL